MAVPASAAPSVQVGAITNLTTSCAGQNAEVESATDPALGQRLQE